MTRKQNNSTPTLSDLEGATNPVEIPGPMPPPGTPARVRQTIDYDIHVSPNQHDTDAYSDELRRIAGEEEVNLPLPEPPTDPLSEFCHIWQNYTGYSLRVTRLPDPANKRVPGQTYANTCFEITALGSIPFDPNNIVPQLQLINGDSGGVLRLFLADENGIAIPGARVDRILIPDPSRSHRNFYDTTDPRNDSELHRRYWERQPQIQAPPQKSETELYIEQMQRELFQKVMMRALDPPAPPPPPDPLSALPADTRLALGLLQEGDVLKTAISRITDLAQAPDRIESATWKDKLADAGLQLVTNNPQIITTATDIISRATVAITTALANAFAPRQAQVVNEPIPVTPQYPQPSRTPAPSLPPQSNRQAIPGLPETPQDDNADNPEDIEIDMMEDITRLLLSEKPLNLNDPVIVGIREEYPAIFDAVMAGIANMPSMSIIQYLCAKSDFCADMFQSSVTGPHLRQRLEELKRLLTQPQPTNAANNIIQTTGETETEEPA